MKTSVLFISAGKMNFQHVLIIPAYEGFLFPLIFLSLSLSVELSPKDFYLYIQRADDLSLTELYIVAFGLPLNVIVTNVS
jgi:hypothetical protein